MSGFLPTDKSKKTIVIPVLIKNGKIQRLDGNELPEIKDVKAKLIVPAHAIKDKQEVISLSDEKDIFILKSGSILLAQVTIKPPMVSEQQLSYINDVRDKYRGYKNLTGCLVADCLVEIELRTDLSMTIRGTKKAKLIGCECYIPFLDVPAYSLNHAYTLISQEFEKWRISHSGNVFEGMYYLKDDKWTCIGELRENIEYQDQQNSGNFNKLSPFDILI